MPICYTIRHGLEKTSPEKKRSKLYALVLMHCPPDPEEILKKMSAWNVVSKAHNAVGLLKVVRDVAHDQTDMKQTVMGFVESTTKLFTYHQDENLSNNNYSIKFNTTIESIGAHGGQPWHHSGPASLHG